MCPQLYIHILYIHDIYITVFSYVSVNFVMYDHQSIPLLFYTVSPELKIQVIKNIFYLKIIKN